MAMIHGDDMMMPKGLRLLARDPEDLSVLSAALQDGLVPPADLAYLAEDQTFVGVFNRFMWEAPPVVLPAEGSPADDEPAGGPAAHHFRTHSALVFRHVARVQTKGLAECPGRPFLCLLAVRSTDEGQTIQLDFADDASIRLTVAEIHVQLEDKGEPWATVNRPRHPFAETPPTP